MSREVYLDQAATSWPKPPGVLAAIEEYFTVAGGNSGRAGHRRALQSARAISLARERLAELLGAESPDQLAFTKNATEALNLAIHGLTLPGGRVVVSSLEHNSVMRPLRALEASGRCSVEVVATDGSTGALDLDEWSERLTRPGACLAVSVHASNVTGVVLPVESMAQAAAAAGVPLLLDAAQTAGHLPLTLARLGATAVAMPGHKGLLGPTGTGLLYLAPGIELEPLIRGGTGSLSELEQQPDFAPDRYESGTLNGIGIVGLGAAAAYLLERDLDEVYATLTALGQRLQAGLVEIPGLQIQGPADPADGVGIVSFTLTGLPCATVARLLDDEFGVMCRAGLHCAPAAHRSLGTAPEGTVRLSWGAETRPDELDYAVEAVRAIAQRSARVAAFEGVV